MRDKRPVDELSVEELERILTIKKREERQQKLKRMERAGRIVAPETAAPPPSPVVVNLGSASILPPELERVVNPPPPVVMSNALSPSAAGIRPQFEDEADYEPPQKKKSANGNRFIRSFVNQMLLLIEVAAIVGLGYLGYQMFTATNALQEESANAAAIADQQRRAALPTLAPTPEIQIGQVVLPGGHIFSDNGDAQFNINEVPESLRYLVASQILQPVISRPPRTPETAVEINIPQLNVDGTIVQGTDWDALKLGVGQMLNGASPTDPQGNVVLAAHNDIYGEYFRYLDQLKVGDEFFVRTETQSYTYRVTEFKTVKPTDLSVLDSRGSATVTLISCYPYKVNTERYIVFAERVV